MRFGEWGERGGGLSLTVSSRSSKTCKTLRQFAKNLRTGNLLRLVIVFFRYIFLQEWPFVGVLRLRRARTRDISRKYEVMKRTSLASNEFQRF